MKKIIAAAAVSLVAMCGAASAEESADWVCTMWVDAAQVGMSGMSGMGGMSGMEGMGGMSGMSGMGGMSGMEGMGGMSGMGGQPGQACAQWTHKSQVK